MANALAAVAILFCLLGAAVAVDRLYRRFAARNPEIGPYRTPDHACGACRGCDGKASTPPE